MSLRDALAQLPELEPPPSLAGRIEARWQARRRRNRAWLGLGGIAGAAIAVAVAITVAPPAPHRAPEVDIAAVRALDRELQLAYATGASDERITTLWQARRTLLAKDTPPGRHGWQPTTL